MWEINSVEKQKPTIMVVDDDSFIRSALTSYLISFDYNVISLEDGEKAVIFFKENKQTHGIDLLIIDQVMPGMDGITTFQKIHSIDHCLPAIMMTGASSISLAVRFIQLGGINFVNKPFMPESGVLAVIVKEALHYKTAIQEQEEGHQSTEKSLKSIKKLFRKTKKLRKITPVFSVKSPWKILVICNNEELHKSTVSVLKDYIFDGQLLEFHTVYSTPEAEVWVRNNKDVAVILLDAMLETEYSGFALIDYIRNNLANKIVRIILRTGEYCEFPEQKVIFDHEIDGYLTNEAFSTQSLTIAVTTSLRAYRDLSVIEQQRQEIIKQKNKALKSEESVLSFLTNLQHETGTVSHQVLAFVDLAITSARAGDQDKVISRLEKAFSAGINLKSYHEDLSFVAHLIAGRVEFVFSEFDLCLSVIAACEVISPFAKNKNVTIEIDESKNIVGKIDRIQIEKAINCLLHNAIKYSDKGSIVQVSLRDKIKYIEISISDRGPGIPDSELEHIFYPFAESSNTGKSTGGRGFGLTIAGNIAKSHGGDITAENRPGGGAVFILRLPKNTEIQD